MLIVLPPSETKAAGGVAAPMSLSFPELDPIRTSLIDDLRSHPITTPATKQAEAAENLTLLDAPVMPAILRYTGVLYEALDAPSLPEDALDCLAVGSALFGLVRATDTIPRYRLSAGTKLAGQTMRSRWGSAITDVLSRQGFVVDLRSGAYQQLGPAPGAVTVRVEQADTGKVISHFNKKYKGELARTLVTSPDIDTAASVGDIAEIASTHFRVDIRGEQLVLLI